MVFSNGYIVSGQGFCGIMTGKSIQNIIPACTTLNCISWKAVTNSSLNTARWLALFYH